MFLHLIWRNKPYQLKVLLFELAMTPKIFTLHAKCILFLGQCENFHITISLDDILVPVCSKDVGNGA